MFVNSSCFILFFTNKTNKKKTSKIFLKPYDLNKFLDYFLIDLNKTVHEWLAPAFSLISFKNNWFQIYLNYLNDKQKQKKVKN